MKDKQIVYLKVNEIKKSRAPLRLKPCPYELNRLAASIKAQGVIVPLLVRINENSEYEVISGNRRLDAAIQIGIYKVPCIVKRTDPKDALILAICENTQCKNLSFFEEAEALYFLVNKYKLSIDAAAKAIGISPSAYSYKIALLNLSTPLRQRLESAELSEDYARLLLKVPEEAREGVLDKIIGENLKFSDAENLVQKVLAQKKNRFLKTAIGDARLFSNSLNKMVDTMKLSGINAVSEQCETENGIEYKITIPK